MKDYKDSWEGSVLPLLLGLAMAGCAANSGTNPAAGAARQPAPRAGLFESKEIAQHAYVYAFPMIANYKALHQFALDPASGQFKAPLNKLWNDADVFTPADTAVVTPNSDTPYSLLEMDLRAEPLVLSMPEVEAGRYYSVQLIDLYTFNYGYIGSRTTGNGPGQFLIAGPRWQGEVPAGIKKVFRSETEFGLAIFRTQLFRPDDIENVRKIQAGYKVQPLSAFLRKPAPPPSPSIHWPNFTGNSFKQDAFSTLSFLLQFCPSIPAEAEDRAAFAEIGIEAGKALDFEKLDLERKLALGLGIKDGFDEISKARADLGEDEKGWRVGAAFGDREFYHGDWLLRAAAAMAGIYGNDEEEALYPTAYVDSEGRKLDARQRTYSITFPEGQLPPVNAFWSITLYDGRTQLLVTNALNRYLVNSSMLPGLKKGADGSLTIYIQNENPGPEKESNWLPAPAGPFYLVMRLYWPKEEVLQRQWKPPGVVATK